MWTVVQAGEGASSFRRNILFIPTTHTNHNGRSRFTREAVAYEAWFGTTSSQSRLVKPKNIFNENFFVDIKSALGNNPALFFLGDVFMTLSSPVFSILLLSGDPEIQAHFRQAFKDASMTTAKDAAALPREAAKRAFDAVIVESKPGMQNGSIGLPHHVDLSRTLLITGSKPVLKRASKTTISGGAAAPWSLEDYVEWKMGDFVKGMRNGSGRNLHPMLISAIERPLITKALQETKGNQIQAAELLGLNRNTLRKKIHALHIPVKRGGRIREL